MIEQTLHGYDRGQRRLAGSVNIGPEDDQAMLAMSDLSGSRVAEGFLEYLTGYMLPSSAYYVVARTWYATEMKRPGCVWTQSLLLAPGVLEAIRNAEALVSLFVRPSLNPVFRYFDRLEVPEAAFHTAEWTKPIPEGLEALCVLEQLYGSDKGSVGISAVSGSTMEPFLLQIWSQLWPELRAKISFCSGSLSLRMLNGRPLDLQCGPDRIRRELQTAPQTPCQQSTWAKTVLEDLLHPGIFSEFLRRNGIGIGTRNSMPALAKVYSSSIAGNIIEALHILIETFPRQEQALELKRSVLGVVKQRFESIEITAVLRLISRQAFALLAFDLTEILKSLALLDSRSLVRAFTSVSQFPSPDFYSLLLDVFVDVFSQREFEWMSDAVPNLFSSLLLERPGVAYQNGFWNWNFSIFDKVEFFRLLIKRHDIDKQLLFDGIFKSVDPELASRLISDLSTDQLPQVLEWVQSHERAATSLEWTSFLRSHHVEFVTWLNQLDNPNLQTVILAANVLDTSPPLGTVLTEASIERLALAVSTLPKDRHEVAAFVLVTTAWVSKPVLASIFTDSFVVLHRAVAQSLLSNRAWHLISSLLMPLPEAEWDVCEKLRRIVLYFLTKNEWDFRPLAHYLTQDLDLFYNFTRTARSYSEGLDFLAWVYAAVQRGEVRLEKKQIKELRKLLGKKLGKYEHVPALHQEYP